MCGVSEVSVLAFPHGSMPFVHLHTHSHYSLLDGLPSPEAYVKKAKEYNAPAHAITDHGNMYGAIEFYKTAKKADIKPIIGIETYTAVTSRFSKQANIDNQIGHLVLLARDKKGYENLMTLSTKAHLEGFYYKPRIDMELLKEHSQGLIILTACLNGILAKSLLANKDEEASAMLQRLQEMVGVENVFVEIQDHPELMEQGILNERLISLARRAKAPIVATNDCHYILPQDKEAHDILLCVQTGSTVDKEDRFKMNGVFAMKSPEEMERSFSYIPEAISNTLVIADQCNVELKLGKNILPSFHTPFEKKSEDYLRELCLEGLEKRYGEHPSQEVLDRLEYELKLIHQMGFDDYFLIVHDFVSFAKNSGILVGPGRGSAAGSIIAYCLAITDIEPLKYGLLFERFLNPERVSMPDIDIDFADDRREEVLNYVVQKYGKDHVAQIITFGTMGARAAVRDVGRVLGIAYGDVDVIAKLIPARPGITLKEALAGDPELRNQCEANVHIKKLMDLAMKLEGVVRHASVHACAVVISDKPLIQYTPLQATPRGETDAIITQYEMHSIEAIGLLKMDFLGLKNLTILQYALSILQRTKNITINLDEIPLEDKETFKLMARGDTTGVFQFESAGMRRYLKELGPTRFEDLIAMNALYRPGPMEWIPSYIKGKHHEKSIHYLHPSFETILKETYGVAVYQEQILQLAQLFAGFSLGEADILRKAVGKKQPELLTKQRSKFIQGAMNKGHTETFAKEVFDKVIEPFAGYGFNKAHATCYAMIAYRTAYLKSHYPAEFMAALMTSDLDDTDRIVLEINECSAMGIEVLPPSINESMANFTVVDDTHIRFGLAAIKGVGVATVRDIYDIRSKSGLFKSIEDFARRVPFSLLNKKTLEALIYAGALDELGERKALLSSTEEISRFARNAQTTAAEGQTDIFSMLSGEDDLLPTFKLAEVPPASHLQCLNWEKQYLGLYVSGHPLQGLTAYLKKKVDLLSFLTTKKIGRMIKVAGILTQIKRITTKSGSPMAYLTLEDPTGRMEVIVFSNTYLQYRSLFAEDSVVVITGKLENRRGSLQLICQNIQTVSLEAMITKAKQAKLYNPKERLQIQAVTLQDETVHVEAPAGSHGEAIPPSAIAAPIKPIVLTLAEHATSPEALRDLKAILLKYQGDLPVELHILSQGLLKRIKVPFGIQMTETLKTEIARFAVIQ